MPLLLAAACAVVSMGVTAPEASAQSVDQCIASKVADGSARPEAVAACIAKEQPATSVAPSARPSLTPASTPARSDGDGTSAATIAVSAGLGAIAGACALALATRSRRRGPNSAAAASTPSGGALPAGLPAPTPPVAAHVDRSRVLIDSLVDLSDRLPSAALRMEVLDTLQRAGVRAVEVAPGVRFDAEAMRGVAVLRTDDPSTVGLVASTERVGFLDGTRVVRLPDVAVHRAD